MPCHSVAADEGQEVIYDTYSDTQGSLVVHRKDFHKLPKCLWWSSAA